jgi:hypothetical protein
VRDAARQCGIDPDARLSHLVVDDVTYGAFQHLYRPIHINYLRGRWVRGNPDPVDIPRRYDSDGVVAACASLPPGFRREALSGDETYCCLKAFR